MAGTSSPRLWLSLGTLAMLLGASGPARAEGGDDVAADIARLRARVAANSAQEQHCMANATRPVWTA